MILQPDDMSNGMFITVLDIKEDKICPPEENQYFNFLLNLATENTSSIFKILKGAVLRIEAINLPYIIVTSFNYGTSSKETSKIAIPLDTRRLSFTKISYEYVLAYLGKNMKKEFKIRE
jgi:hypothetical protein